jgi:hypothetical protein
MSSFFGFVILSGAKDLKMRTLWQLEILRRLPAQDDESTKLKPHCVCSANIASR